MWRANPDAGEQEDLDSGSGQKSSGSSVDDGLLQKSSYEKRFSRMRKWAVPTRLDRSLVREFMELDQGGKIQVEYVYLDHTYTDGDQFDICSKSITLDKAPTCVEDLGMCAYARVFGFVMGRCTFYSTHAF